MSRVQSFSFFSFLFFFLLRLIFKPTTFIRFAHNWTVQTDRPRWTSRTYKIRTDDMHFWIFQAVATPAWQTTVGSSLGRDGDRETMYYIIDARSVVKHFLHKTLRRICKLLGASKIGKKKTKKKNTNDKMRGERRKKKRNIQSSFRIMFCKPPFDGEGEWKEEAGMSTRRRAGDHWQWVENRALPPPPNSWFRARPHCKYVTH